MHEVSVSCPVDHSSPSTKKVQLKPPLGLMRSSIPMNEYFFSEKLFQNPISSHLWHHSIPGWFGTSGALIGHIIRNERDELTPTIIGMVKVINGLR